MTKQQEQLNHLYMALGKMFADMLNSTPYLSGPSMKFKGPKNERQRAVVEAFQHAWKSYKKFAWGHDELRPVSERPLDWLQLGETIVNSLDTIYIMNLTDGR